MITLVKEDTGNIRHYQCYTTDAKETWPTDCALSSTMTVLDTTTKLIDRFEYFGGAAWYEL